MGYRPKQKYVSQIGGLFAILRTGKSHFCNRLRARMEFPGVFGTHTPSKGKVALTDHRALHLLASSINYAGLKAWISGRIQAGAVTHFNNGDYEQGTIGVANTLHALNMQENLAAAMSVTASIQTAFGTLPASGPVAWLLNGESVGSAAIEKYLKVSTDRAVDDLISVLKRASR